MADRRALAPAGMPGVGFNAAFGVPRIRCDRQQRDKLRTSMAGTQVKYGALVFSDLADHRLCLGFDPDPEAIRTRRGLFARPLCRSARARLDADLCAGP